MSRTSRNVLLDASGTYARLVSRYEPRYQLSREEVGILLSFATRPHAVTEEWVTRLEGGVREAELAEFVAVAGLPGSSVERIVATRSVDNDGASGWTQRTPAFRRAVVGILAIYVLAAVALSFATGEDSLRNLSLAVAFVLSGIVVYRVIIRLSGGTT